MKLSVIVPVYNVEEYLAKCLDSVIEPDIRDYEIVCLNDGSTDGSGDILRDYEARYPGLIRVIEQENAGLSEARNNAIRAAAGEYVFLLDSDDYMESGSIQRFMELIEKNADMVIIEYKAVDETGRMLSRTKTYKQNGYVHFEEHPEIMFVMPTGLFRRSLFVDNDIFYPRGKLYEDLATMPKVFLHTKTIYYSDEVLYNYLKRSGSIMNSGNVARNTDIFDALNGITAYYKEHDAFEKYYNELEYIHYYNEYITSIVRLSKLPGHGDLPARFRSDFLAKFPNYRKNPYILAEPKKIQLLDKLISMKLFGAVAFVMNMNDRVKKQ